jgi:hypothetical protein
MMRTIWIAEQRRQAERKAREAAYVPPSQEEELEGDVRKQKSFDCFQISEGTSLGLIEIYVETNVCIDEAMVDEVARFEDAEIEAALSSVPKENNSRPCHPYERPETPYCSDDEEYDSVFLEVIEEVERNSEDEEEYGHIFQDYPSEDESKDRKHVSAKVDTNKADHDMMDIT